MEPNTSESDPNHLLELSAQSLGRRDFSASRRFALSAKALDPNLFGADQILAVVDVLLAANRRLCNGHFDHYSILQIPKSEPRILISSLKNLLGLLDPAKNKYPFSIEAYNLIFSSWYFLADPGNRTKYDEEISGANEPPNREENMGSSAKEQGKGFVCSEVGSNGNGNRSEKNNQEQESSGNERGKGEREWEKLSTFWTLCPYCSSMYEYEKVYEECCLLCQKCRRGFHGAAVAAPPTSVLKGKEYYYGFGRFSVGYSKSDSSGYKKANGDEHKTKEHDVVEISDDSDDDNGTNVMEISDDGDDDKGTNVRTEESHVKEELAKGGQEHEDSHAKEEHSQGGEAECLNVMQEDSYVEEGLSKGGETGGLNVMQGSNVRNVDSHVEEKLSKGSEVRGLNVMHGSNVRNGDSHVNEELCKGDEAGAVNVMQGSEGIVGKGVRRRMKVVGICANKVMGKGRKIKKTDV